MNALKKIRVAVLYGGRSAEHEVSLRTATNVMQNLDTTRFEVIPIGIDKKGNWFLGEDIYRHSLAASQVPLLSDTRPAWFTPEGLSKQVHQQDIQELILKKQHSSLFDVIFPAVHGTFCEDGTLQGLLEIANLPYVGCGVLASAVGMDKDISKRLVSLTNIQVGPYRVIKHEQWLKTPKQLVTEIEQTLAYPIFVKPVNTGSSIGVSKVKTMQQLIAAIEQAFQYDRRVILEKALDIIELEVAVLESLTEIDPIISIVGQVNPTHEFYSYDAKYTDENGAELLIPALLSNTLSQKVQQIAKLVFQTLECEGMARVDLFLDKHSEKIYFNEINTLPGFTTISMYPKLMAASGFSYSNLLTHLIELAIKKHQQKNKLLHNYTN